MSKKKQTLWEHISYWLVTVFLCVVGLGLWACGLGWVTQFHLIWGLAYIPLSCAILLGVISWVEEN